MTEHERIWLEPAPGADEDYGRQWAQHNVWPDGIEYIRADLAESALEEAQHDAVAAETELRIVRAALSTRPAQEPVAVKPDMLRLAVAAVLEADKEFRAQMPPGWDGDPLTDELDGLRRVFETQPALSSQRGEDSTPSPVENMEALRSGKTLIMSFRAEGKGVDQHRYDTISSLEARIEELEGALKPFRTDWADENGWTEFACQGDRVVDWFGPSDFFAARRALSKGTGQ